MSKQISNIIDGWNKFSSDFFCTSEEFYSKVEQLLRDQEIPDLKMKRVDISESTGMFSDKREYLRITRKDLTYDVGLAPFGKCIFISCWFGENIGTGVSLLDTIPIIGKVSQILHDRKKAQTYFQADSQAIFKSAVTHAINEAIDYFQAFKGQRTPENVVA